MTDYSSAAKPLVDYVRAFLHKNGPWSSLEAPAALAARLGGDGALATAALELTRSGVYQGRPWAQIELDVRQLLGAEPQPSVETRTLIAPALSNFCVGARLTGASSGQRIERRHFRAPTNRTGLEEVCSAIRIEGAAEGFTLFDSDLEEFTCAIELVPLNGARLRDATIESNIIRGSWGGPKPQGLYGVYTDRLSVRGNVFADIGMRSPTMWAHGLYLNNGNTECSVTGNLFYRCANFAAEMRAGGAFKGNLCVECADGYGGGGGGDSEPMEAGGVVIDVDDNLYVWGRAADFGRDGAVVLSNIAGGSVRRQQLVGPCQPGSMGTLFRKGAPDQGKPPHVGVRNVTVEDFRVRDWKTFEGNFKTGGDALHAGTWISGYVEDNRPAPPLLWLRPWIERMIARPAGVMDGSYSVAKAIERIRAEVAA